jgi:hypothetical protein
MNGWHDCLCRAYGTPLEVFHIYLPIFHAYGILNPGKGNIVSSENPMYADQSHSDGISVALECP